MAQSVEKMDLFQGCGVIAGIVLGCGVVGMLAMNGVMCGRAVSVLVVWLLGGGMGDTAFLLQALHGRLMCAPRQALGCG